VWSIVSEEREKGNAGKLHLPKLAQDIIAQQPRIHGNPFIFPARGVRSFSSWGWWKAELDKTLPGMKPWRIHDLRRTARSLMSRADVRPDIAERVMGHAIAGIEGIYDRFEYFAEKGDALNRLAALIQSIVNPPTGNVVPMKQRRRR
jgi:integrase